MAAVSAAALSASSPARLRDVGEVQGDPVGHRGESQVVTASCLRHLHVEARGRGCGGGLAAPRLHVGDLLYGRQCPQHAAEQLLVGGAQHALRLEVDEGDPPVVVRRKEAVAHMAQGVAERVAGGPGLVAVPGRPDHPVGLAHVIELHPCARLGPAVTAVGASYSIFGLEYSAVANGPLDGGERPRQVVGVDHLHPALDLGREVGGLGAVDGHGRSVPGQCAGADVPLPGAYLDCLERLPQEGAARLLPGGASGWRGLDHPLLRPGGHRCEELPLFPCGLS